MDDDVVEAVEDGSLAEDQEHDRPWFAGREGTVLVYKVNRRPLLKMDVFEQFRPSNVMEHLASVLGQDLTTKTGRRHQRDWRIGNLDVKPRSIVGLLGWSRHGETLANIYDEESRTWTEEVVPQEASGVAPFAVVDGRRYVGVLHHPSFDEATVATVLTNLLNAGERNLASPTTEWAVEPVGDLRKFDRWLDRVDRITSLTFVFRRPNPDAEADFQFLFDRLDRVEAAQIYERLTPRDPEEGLNKDGLREDEETQGYVSAAMAAYGHVSGKGYRGEKKYDYDQREKMLKVTIDRIGDTWDEAVAAVRKRTRRAATRRKRARDGKSAS